MRPFNKTTATLVRPHPFSTLCPTPLGNSPVCFSERDVLSVEIWEISGPQSGETRSETGKCDGKCDRILETGF